MTKTRATNLFFIIGKEPYLKTFFEDRLMKSAAHLAQDAFNYQVFIGEDVPLLQIETALETPPVFSAEKAIFLKNRGLHTLSTEEADAFVAMIADVPKDVFFVISEASDGFGDPKNAVIKKVMKAVDKAGGAVLQIEKMGSSDHVAFVLKRVGQRGSKITRENASRLASFAQGDILRLQNEVEKLTSFANGTEITAAMIDALVVPHFEMSIFNLSKAILENNYHRALEILTLLFENGEEPVLILNALAMKFSDLVRAKAMARGGISVAQAAEDFGYKNRVFALQNAQKEAKKCTERQLSLIVQELLLLDQALRTSTLAKPFLFECTITEIFRILNKK